MKVGTEVFRYSSIVQVLYNTLLILIIHSKDSITEENYLELEHCLKLTKKMGL